MVPNSVFAGTPDTEENDPVDPETLQRRSGRELQFSPKRADRSFAREPSAPIALREDRDVNVEKCPRFTR
jgi:hypothetical protein